MPNLVLLKWRLILNRLNLGEINNDSAGYSIINHTCCVKYKTINAISILHVRIILVIRILVIFHDMFIYTLDYSIVVV